MNAFLIGIPGGPEIWIICLVILILFGGAAIPKFMKSLGKAKSEFEKGVKEGKEESEKDAAKKDADEKEDEKKEEKKED